MMKKVISIFFVIAMILSLTACGGTKNNENGGNTNGGDTNGESSDLKVALVVNQRFGDNGPMDDMSKGADRAAADFGVTVKKLESTSAANFEEDIRAMSREGYNLIVTTFPYMSEATKKVAQEFPDVKYAAVFQFINDENTKIENVWDSEFHGEQAFYIGGYIAGKLTKSNKIGLLIGGEEPTPNAEGNAFMRGVKAANADASVEFSFIGSYEDPAKAKEITSAMISKGCDVIQTNSGASNAGVIEEAKNAGVICAGEITDFYSTYDGFYGVIGIGFGDTVYKAIEMLKNNTFIGGEHSIRDLSNGGYFIDWNTFERFADENSEYGADMKAAIEEAKKIEEDIMHGDLQIEFDTSVPNWSKIQGE